MRFDRLLRSADAAKFTDKIFAASKRSSDTSDIAMVAVNGVCGVLFALRNRR
jgi:hypothetical protein